MSNNGIYGFIKPDIGGANVHFKTEICYPGAKVGDYVETVVTTNQKGRSAVSIRRIKQPPSPGPDPQKIQGVILKKEEFFGFIKPDIGGANVYFKTEICYPDAKVGDYVETFVTTDQKGKRSAVSIQRISPRRNPSGRGQSPGRPRRNSGVRDQDSGRSRLDPGPAAPTEPSSKKSQGCVLM